MNVSHYEKTNKPNKQADILNLCYKQRSFHSQIGSPSFNQKKKQKKKNFDILSAIHVPWTTRLPFLVIIAGYSPKPLVFHNLKQVYVKDGSSVAN